MNFLGHEKQKKLLLEMASSGNLPHNLLFTGPEAVGKKKVALEFIKFLNCAQKDGCGKCSSCIEIEKKRSPDLFLIEEDKEIKIDQIRDLQKRISLTGSKKDSYKAAIIDKAHFLNSQAQACLLKTLEEPKGKALIILITEKPNTLLKTILSRMWSIKFSSVETELIEKHLIDRGASEKKAKEIAEETFSRPGLAIKMFESKKFKKDWETKKKDLKMLQDSYLGKRFNYVKKMAKDKENARETLKIWLSFLRSEMLNSKDEKIILKNKESLKTIEDVLLLTSKTNVNLRLALEKVIINI